MSRLYVKSKTDTGAGKGLTAHQNAKTQIYWGSVGDSKLAAEIEVQWRKGASKPMVFLDVGAGVELVYVQEPLGNKAS